MTLVEELEKLIFQLMLSGKINVFEEPSESEMVLSEMLASKM